MRSQSFICIKGLVVIPFIDSFVDSFQEFQHQPEQCQIIYVEHIYTGTVMIQESYVDESLQCC